MSGAREEILGRIRAALDPARPLPDQGAEAERRLFRRLSHPRPNLVPERGRGNELAQQLISEMERVDGTTARVTALAGAPRAIAAFLAENSLPGTLKVAPDPLLKNLPWRDERDLSVEFGRAYDRDPVGVSAAFAGVAETGTLMLVSGADGPVTVSFLPTPISWCCPSGAWPGPTKTPGPGCGARPAKGTPSCPVPSIGSPGLRAPPISNKACFWAPMVPAACM